MASARGKPKPSDLRSSANASAPCHQRYNSLRPNDVQRISMFAAFSIASRIGERPAGVGNNELEPRASINPPNARRKARMSPRGFFRARADRALITETTVNGSCFSLPGNLVDCPMFRHAWQLPRPVTSHELVAQKREHVGNTTQGRPRRTELSVRKPKCRTNPRH